MYRVLVAFVMNVTRPECIDDIADLIDKGRFDMNEMHEYCKKWSDRFDLFDKKHPFYQVLVDEPVTPGKVIDGTKSVAELFKQVPVATNVMHFSMPRVHDDEHAASPASCARALCAIPPFATSGGVGFSPCINKTPPVYVLVTGKNLFETIVLNMPSIPIEENSGTGPVAWESDEITSSGEIGAVSTLQGMTFQSRRVHLFPGEKGTCTITGKESPVLVHGITYEPGFKFTGKWTDPSVAHVTTDKGRNCMHMQEGKDTWRDTGPIMMTLSSTHGSDKKGNKIVFERPVVVHQWNVLVREKMLPWRSIVVNVHGLRSDKAKLCEWQSESLFLPTGVMQDPDAGDHVSDAMKSAETVDYALRSSIKKLYPRDGKGNKNAFDSIIANASHEFWSMLEPTFRDGYIQSIANRDKDDVNAWATIDIAWKKHVVKSGRAILDSFIDSAGTVARFIVKGIEARDTFNKKTGYIQGKRLVK
jgi:CRISPR type I-E-associated protein CasA/Cse1